MSDSFGKEIRSSMQNISCTGDSIEIFCGTGGLALGLQRAGFHHKALYEWDKDSCNNIKANIAAGFNGIADWNVYQSDVRAVSYDGLMGKIKMISGGPPCQPFSLGGKSQAHNDERDMFPEAVRAVREIRPEVFIFENVKGLLRQSFNQYFRYIILQLTYPSLVKPQGVDWQEHLALLEQHYASSHRSVCKHSTCPDSIGEYCGCTDSTGEYHVTFCLLNAADYGVPQLRHRVFIVGFREDLDAHWSFPTPTHSKESLLHAKWITGDYWDQHDLPTPKVNPLSKQAIKNVCKAVEERDLPLLPWQTTRDAISDLPDLQSTEALAFNNHIFRAGAKIYPGHSGSMLDEPSKTIKAGSHGVPGGENMLVLDNGEVRYYTVRESARIQTFPDDYKFFASWTESMRQIGNAVPVKLAEVIGRSVYACLNKRF